MQAGRKHWLGNPTVLHYGSSKVGVRHMWPRQQSSATRAGFGTHSFDDVNYFVSHPVDLDEKFVADHYSSENQEIWTKGFVVLRIENSW